MQKASKQALILALCAAALCAPLAVARAAEIEGARANLARIVTAIDAQETEAMNRRAEAERLDDELALLRAEEEQAARSVAAHAADIGRIEQTLVELGREAITLRQALSVRSALSGSAAVALARVARRPAYAALVLPGAPTDQLRSGLLLRAALPALEIETTRLRTEIETLAANERAQEERRQALDATGRTLELERARLADLSSRTQALLADARIAQEEASRRIGLLVNEAKDLNDLVGRLERFDRERKDAEAEERRRAAEERARREAEQAARTQERLAAVRPIPRPAPDRSGRPISQAQGALAKPVEGRLLVAYGDRASFGPAAKGMTLATRPRAPVVAPYAGRVAFSGPFRQFGQILIIEHGEGYHTLLAGLARVEVAVGQWVATGELVGATGEAAEDAAEDRAAEAKDAGAPTLYVELRRQGQPIDPQPWLAGNNDKVRG